MNFNFKIDRLAMPENQVGHTQEKNDSLSKLQTSTKVKYILKITMVSVPQWFKCLISSFLSIKTRYNPPNLSPLILVSAG